MSKLGKIFKAVAPFSPIARLISPNKKKTTFINLAPKATTPAPVAKQTPAAETSERRRRIAKRLKSGGRSDTDVATINNEDEGVIRRAAARRAKLLGG